MTSAPYACTGPDELGTVDLLAVALGQRALATALLEQCGDASALLAASPAALARTLGAARASRLHASFTLARRALSESPVRGRVTSADDAAAWFLPRLTGLAHEELHALFLDRRGGVLAAKRMSQGSPDHTLFDVRHILGEAVRAGAYAILVGHNHPSGDPEPSTEDLLVTRRLAEGAALLGLALHDHVVVGAGRWVSMATRGDLHPMVTRFPAA
ncbi:MAG: hypothetical protein EXR71_06265 [Myxococcales bacterium]|nr:hypothetical protein [Myxococcales bacterium]